MAEPSEMLLRRQTAVGSTNLAIVYVGLMHFTLLLYGLSLHCVSMEIKMVDSLLAVDCCSSPVFLKQELVSKLAVLHLLNTSNPFTVGQMVK